MSFTYGEPEYTLYDDNQVEIDTLTWQEWWEVSLQPRGWIQEDYGRNLDNLKLIQLMEEQWNFVWDWDEWRRQYYGL